jgi:protein-tyrosine phosphatase
VHPGRGKKVPLMFMRASLALALTAVSIAHADVVHLKCIQTGKAEYKVSYDLTGSTRSVEIFASKDPNVVPAAAPLRKTAEKTITLRAGEPGDRMYFYVKADTGEVREVSIRHLELEGTPNFRDIGGYETTDGRYVRWGLLYRSGVLTYLTPSDYTYLSNLGIRVVCDFRTKQENDAAPETWVPGANAEMMSLPIGGDGKQGSNQATLQGLLASNPSAEELRARMTATYGQFAFSAADQYAAVFQQLKHEHLPLLYHCSAGKDRTGVFSAFLLLTLGVPEKTVVEDYALTNRYLQDAKNSASVQKMVKASGTTLSSLSKEQQSVMMAADPAYLESTLRQIDAKYGSFDAYRRTELKVSDADVQTLRARLTLP